MRVVVHVARVQYARKNCNAATRDDDVNDDVSMGNDNHLDYRHRLIIIVIIYHRRITHAQQTTQYYKCIYV